MQITKLVPFMSGCRGREREGEKITIIQQDPNPKCSSKATSCSEPGQKKKKSSQSSNIPGSVQGDVRRNEKTGGFVIMKLKYITKPFLCPHTPGSHQL